MMELGSGMQQKIPKPSAQLRTRLLFLLHALLTSDDAIIIERYKQFQDAISFICMHAIDEGWEEDAEIRRMNLVVFSQLQWYKPTQSDQLSIQEQVLKVVLQHKSHIRSIGVTQIQAICNLNEGSKKREYATLELVSGNP